MSILVHWFTLRCNYRCCGGEAEENWGAGRRDEGGADQTSDPEQWADRRRNLRVQSIMEDCPVYTRAHKHTQTAWWSMCSYLGRWRRCLSPRTRRWHIPAQQLGWGTWTQLRCPASSADPPPARCRAPWKLHQHTQNVETAEICFKRENHFGISEYPVTHDGLNVNGGMDSEIFLTMSTVRHVWCHPEYMENNIHLNSHSCWSVMRDEQYFRLLYIVKKSTLTL